MGALRPDTTLEVYQAEAYNAELGFIAARLRQCANDVEHRGAADADGKGGQVKGAQYVVSAITSCLANLPLNRLIELAHAADRPANTPAVLLDRAAGGIMAALYDTPDQEDEDRAVELAEAALRGAGVIR